MKGIGRKSSKTTEIEISIAMTLSVVEEAKNASSVGNNRARSNRRSREDKCIVNRDRQEEEFYTCGGFGYMA